MIVLLGCLSHPTVIRVYVASGYTACAECIPSQPGLVQPMHLKNSIPRLSRRYYIPGENIDNEPGMIYGPGVRILEPWFPWGSLWSFACLAFHLHIAISPRDCIASAPVLSAVISFLHIHFCIYKVVKIDRKLDWAGFLCSSACQLSVI
jgi:hypothetical protein